MATSVAQSNYMHNEFNRCIQCGQSLGEMQKLEDRTLLLINVVFKMVSIFQEGSFQYFRDNYPEVISLLEEYGFYERPPKFKEVRFPLVSQIRGHDFRAQWRHNHFDGVKERTIVPLKSLQPLKHSDNPKPEEKKFDLSNPNSSKYSTKASDIKQVDNNYNTPKNNNTLNISIYQVSPQELKEAEQETAIKEAQSRGSPLTSFSLLSLTNIGNPDALNAFKENPSPEPKTPPIGQLSKWLGPNIKLDGLQCLHGQALDFSQAEVAERSLDLLFRILLSEVRNNPYNAEIHYLFQGLEQIDKNQSEGRYPRIFPQRPFPRLVTKHVKEEDLDRLQEIGLLKKEVLQHGDIIYSGECLFGVPCGQGEERIEIEDWADQEALGLVGVYKIRSTLIGSEFFGISTVEYPNGTIAQGTIVHGVPVKGFNISFAEKPGVENCLYWVDGNWVTLGYGDRYEGCIRNGFLPDGLGTLFLKNGKTYSGRWEKGCLIEFL